VVLSSEQRKGNAVGFRYENKEVVLRLLISFAHPIMVMQVMHYSGKNVGIFWHIWLYLVQ
jgi:hypothetical protein